MRELRYAGPGEEPTHVVVESADGLDRFTLLLDDPLRAAARQELPRLHDAAEETVSLSPRDIQTRVRAGASPESVAEESGLALDKVMRFAFPVLQERRRVADEARRARARRTDAVGEIAIFGELVDAKLAAHEIDPADVAWDSFRRLDGTWTVTAGWREGEAERFAQWSFVLSSRAITAVDDTAADLLSDRPLRPLATADDEPAEQALEDEHTVGGAFEPLDVVEADPTHPTGPVPTGLRLAPPPADTHETSDARGAAGTHGASGDRVDPFAGAPWPSDPSPRGLGSFFERAQAGVGGRPAGTSRPQDNRPQDNRPQDNRRQHPAEHRADPVPPAAAARSAVDVTDDAVLPLEVAPATAPRPVEEPADAKAARARIPSWDDILLGVRRRGD